jgi:hypothetical protein
MFEIQNQLSVKPEVGNSTKPLLSSRLFKFRFYDTTLKKMCYRNPLTYDFCVKDIIPMQFTGLLDKNGIKIFEGDIIEYTQHHFNTDMIKTKRKVVEWKYDKWGVYETNAGESDIQILGNIFENVDLLQDVL